jgi:ribosomal protein S18 acetylase RimI-like enzyme
MVMKLIKNDEKYYEFIRTLRIHEDNISGFINQSQISKEDQINYMSEYKNNYYICINEFDQPLGWIGQVDNDIRLCVEPTFKNMGVGTFMLGELYKLYPNANGKVLKNNIVSNKLFIKCGFTLYKEDNNFKYYKKNGIQ